jgi:hypothetical protein
MLATLLSKPAPDIVSVGLGEAEGWLEKGGRGGLWGEGG